MGTLSQIQLEAALAEQIYHRDTKDGPIGLDQLGVKPVDLGATIGGLVASGNANDLVSGMSYYSPRGFVGEAVIQGDTVYVVFRGTDLSGSFPDGLAAGAASGLDQTAPQASDGKIDVGDCVNDLLLGTGFSGQTQLDDALALTQAAQQFAQAKGMNVVVVGQSLGGGLAGLVSAIANVRGYAIDPAPFENQLFVTAQEQALVQTGLDLGQVSAASFTNNPFNLPLSGDPATSQAAAALAKLIITTLLPTANSAAMIAQTAFLLWMGNSPLSIFDYFQNVHSDLALFQINMLSNLTVSRVSGEIFPPATSCTGRTRPSALQAACSTKGSAATRSASGSGW